MRIKYLRLLKKIVMVVVKMKLIIKQLKKLKIVISLKVFASPETFLNLEDLDELSRSIIKIDFDDRIVNEDETITQFRNELEHLFGKKKKYTDKSSARKAQDKIADIYVTKKIHLISTPIEQS